MTIPVRSDQLKLDYPGTGLPHAQVTARSTDSSSLDVPGAGLPFYGISGGAAVLPAPRRRIVNPTMSFAAGLSSGDLRLTERGRARVTEQGRSRVTESGAWALPAGVLWVEDFSVSSPFTVASADHWQRANNWRKGTEWCLETTQTGTPGLNKTALMNFTTEGICELSFDWCSTGIGWSEFTVYLDDVYALADSRWEYQRLDNRHSGTAVFLLQPGAHSLELIFDWAGPDSFDRAAIANLVLRRL